PICRKVEDLAYLMPLLMGPDGKDPVTVESEWTDPESVDISSLKAFFFDYNGESRPNPEVRRAVSMAAGALASAGVPVEHWRPEGMEDSLAIWQAGMAQNPDPLAKSLGDGEPVPLGKELLKFIARQSKLTLPGLGAALIEKPGQLLKKRNQNLLGEADRMREMIEEKLGDNGVLICPVFPVPAPRHSRIWLNFSGIGYSGVINILGFPATIIPVFHRPDGVPVSVQVVSRRFGDHLTLAAAKKLEEVFGGWRYPAKIK
ncbi:MAG: amidase family protein, partial [bacterium]